jgi:tetratricopeptide (TPR) repeat protein
MVCWRLAIICLLTVLGSLPLRAADPPETRAFNSASEAFRAALYPRAEVEFADFLLKHPNSPRAAEAVLFQAQARLQQSNYVGAITLLAAKQAQAGTLADQYLFWQAESLLRKGDSREAAATFRSFADQFPTSDRRLEASLGQAAAFEKLGEWENVIGTLSQTNGAFQVALQNNATNDLVLRGYLVLAEAFIARKDFPAAEMALDSAAKLPSGPAADWQRQFLICRLRVEQGRATDALQGTTNLIALAGSAGQRQLLADSIVLRASIFERLGRIDDAIAAYQQNLLEILPADQQRRALLRITELALAHGRIPAAIQALEKFLAQQPAAADTDLALLTLGEMKLRQLAPMISGTRLITDATNNVATNLLQQATAVFEGLIKNHPQSPLLGKALLNLGWCLLLDGKTAECQPPLQQAIAKLPPSIDQATAYFKLADAQFQEKNFAAALTNYETLATRFSEQPQVRNTLLEPALYQAVRAGLATGGVESATNSLFRILSWFPNGFHADRAVLLTGQEYGRRKDLARARELFLTFLNSSANAELKPEIELAIARTYEQETNWDAAITRYDTWIQVHTNHPAIPRAEYCRAWATFQSGNEASTLGLMTNFIARWPSNELASLAQWWVADYRFRLGGPGLVEAEKNYQLLYQNWPNSEFAHQARMMAGRVAVARQGWADAQAYFTKLWNDTNCPIDLRIQALYAYGDTLISMDSGSTNRLANYNEALSVFGRICDLYPTNPITPLAWGQRANCLLQWVQASPDPTAVSNACHAFQQVIDSPASGVQARSIALVGLALATEKGSARKSPDETVQDLRRARNFALDVFLGNILRNGDKPDVFWTRKAGLEAGRLSEALQEWPQAIKIYEKLIEMMPSLRNRFEKNIERVRDQMAREKS